MTHAEYEQLTDLRAIRVACGALVDVIGHQPPARRHLCDVMIAALNEWSAALRSKIAIDDGEETPSDAP